ncbi:MAG: hypothetical protein II328_03820 [Clostridia bacterium]|nr:hypothetical protein [Clostridia bacterium]
MQILKNPTSPFPQGTAVMLGQFDGFHRAHRRLAQLTVSYAQANSLIPVAFTFTGRKQKGTLLSTDEEKAAFFHGVGIQTLVTFDFETLREMSPEDFTQQILLSTLSANAVFCGFNYRFGKGAVASTRDLSRLLDARAALFVLPEMKDEKSGTSISSTNIRSLIEQKRYRDAERLLGHPLPERFKR